MDIVYFVVFVSVLIFVHELGHFVCAKLFGVKVLMFSIGFGPKIVRIRGRETEYCVGLLPLGGFVQMLEENRHEPVLPEDLSRTFEAQALYKRIIIVLAGPAMNLLFPVLLYLALFAGHSQFSPPTVGVVLPGHAAHGKLLPGDRVLEVDGVRITTFAELMRSVRKSPERELKLKVFRDNQHVLVSLTPAPRRDQRALGVVDVVGTIGVGPNRPAPVVGIVDAESPAYRAGLRSFDMITEIRGKPVGTFADLEKMLARNRGETVPVTYLRPRRVAGAVGSLADLYVYESGLVALTPETGQGSLLERTGMEPSDLFIANVRPESAEARAGLRQGDRLLKLNDTELSSWSMYREILLQAPGAKHRLSWLRDGRTMEASLKLDGLRRVSDETVGERRKELGAHNWAPRVPQAQVGRPSLLNYALPEALDETWDVIRFIVIGLVKIARLELDLSTIGGPITVYDVVAQERQKGTSYLLWAMAVISINLGLINLLPIPVLDGGHLMFLGAEALLRRPLPLRARELASLFGFVVLLVLMGWALKNDIEKRWDIIAAQVRELTE